MNNKKIKEIMKAQGYTIEMLSLISNIPVGTLSKIISGITANPGFETMSAIATALNCSLDEFSGRPVTIPYDYEEYLRRFKQLPVCQKEYIKYVIDLEYDRMTRLKTNEKMTLRCYEFTNIVNGWAEFDSVKTHKNVLLKSLNGTIDDISVTDYYQYRRVGRYVGCMDVPELTTEKAAFQQD